MSGVREFLLGRPLPECPYESSRLPQDYEGSPPAWGETGPKTLDLTAASEATGCFVADLWLRTLQNTNHTELSFRTGLPHGELEVEIV
jgi:hypothetical protein